MIDLRPLQKLPKNVGDLGTLIVAKALKSRPKCKKSPNLVTLITMDSELRYALPLAVSLHLGEDKNFNLTFGTKNFAL